MRYIFVWCLGFRFSFISINFFLRSLRCKKIFPWSNNTQLVHDFYMTRTIIFSSDVVNVKFLFHCINLSGARSIHSSFFYSKWIKEPGQETFLWPNTDEQVDKHMFPKLRIGLSAAIARVLFRDILEKNKCFLDNIYKKFLLTILIGPSIEFNDTGLEESGFPNDLQIFLELGAFKSFFWLGAVWKSSNCNFLFVPCSWTPDNTTHPSFSPPGSCGQSIENLHKTKMLRQNLH